MINIRPDGTSKHKSETCGVETRDLAAALADRLSEASRAHPSVKHARLILLVGAAASCDRSDPVAASPGAIDGAAVAPAIPDVFAVCDVGTGPSLDIIERALPLGSVPVVTDVLRAVLADGSVVEKSRIADIDLRREEASAAYSNAVDATRGCDRGGAGRVRTYWFPPAHHHRADVVVRSSNNADASSDETGGAARSSGGPEAPASAHRPLPAPAVASGFVIVSSTCCRHGDGRNEPPPCVGPLLALERLQRISVAVSRCASLVLEYAEGGAVTVYVDAERGASRSSVRRALLPLVDHFGVTPAEEGQRRGSGTEGRYRGGWSPSPSSSAASASSASVRPARSRAARGDRSWRAYTSKELPPPPE